MYELQFISVIFCARDAVICIFVWALKNFLYNFENFKRGFNNVPFITY